MADLQEALAVIRGKVALYAEHLAAGSADSLWRNGPTCPNNIVHGHGQKREVRRPAAIPMVGVSVCETAWNDGVPP